MATTTSTALQQVAAKTSEMENTLAEQARLTEGLIPKEAGEKRAKTEGY